MTRCNFYKAVVDYLNAKANKKFRHSSQKTQGHINARFQEGFTLEDFLKVIDIKTEQWGNDPVMRKYLRPETLFAGKFENYLNEYEDSKYVETWEDKLHRFFKESE